MQRTRSGHDTRRAVVTRNGRDPTMKASEFEQLNYRVENRVAYIQLNRPAALNSFTSQLYGEVKWAMRIVDHDPGVDIAVITGAGRSFATGGDLKETLRRLKDTDDPLSMYEFFDRTPWAALRDCRKTTIAAINGLCYAGGLITAALCDISIAAQSARFCIAEAKVGIADQQIPTIMFGRISPAKLKYYVMTAKPFSPEVAEEIGLITEVVPDDKLDERVEEVVTELRGTSPVAREEFKGYMNRLIPWPPTDGGERAFASKAVIEGLSAFAEKRPVRYDQVKE
jgi:enoyl-CoA hydratase/carnithine racemase